jgi:uncharacterized membrane protein YidH (DUF202 family)
VTVVDPGASNERTALAWQRTALSLAAGCIAMARLTWSALGAITLVPLVGAGVLAVWVFVESRRRYAHDAGTRSRGRARSGRAPFALVGSSILVAVCEIAALLAQ